ncbi:MAG: Redoxin domain protein [Francisellaceae bacterium]|nr:Redoxin domain protein [Francisellaceae bacterium]
MSTITFKGNPIQLVGNLPTIGQVAPAFTVTRTDLSELNSASLAGKKILLNIFPSLDTPTCSRSVKEFNAHAKELPNTTFLCISQDLPFAHDRFCSTQNLDKVITGSVFRHPEFGQSYGLTIVDAPLKGLLARTVILIGQDGKINYIELVNEISQEPNYEQALKAIASAS